MRQALPAALFAGAALLLAATPAVAAPAWLSPVELSGGQDGRAPQIAVDAEGDATAVWETYQGGVETIVAARRPAGGPWEPGVTISAPGIESFGPSVAVDAAGDATVVWEVEGEEDTTVEAATRPAAGVWEAPHLLGSEGEAVEIPAALAVDAAGDAVVVWADEDGGGSTVESASRPAGGSWSAAAPLSQAGEAATEPWVAIDATGDAAAVWIDREAEEAVMSASRPAAGSWGTPEPVTAAGEAAYAPKVGLGAAGDATAVWERTDSSQYVIRESDRPATAGWSTPRRISPSGIDAFTPALAEDAVGDAVVAWGLRTSISEVVIGVNNRIGAGPWGEPTTVSPAGGYALEQQVGIDAAGDATVAWKEGLAKNSSIDAAMRPAAGAWSAAVAVSAPGGYNERPALAVDPGGDALLAWGYIDESADHLVRSAAFDAVGPALRSLSIPASGVIGIPLAFSVAPLDGISPIAATTWSFGDGGSAATASASHTYTAPGTYTVTVTSVDAAGNSSTASGEVPIVAAPPPAPPPAKKAKLAAPRVKVSCPKRAAPTGCHFALQVFSARPHKAKGKGKRARAAKPVAESLVAVANLRPGKSATPTLTPKRKYAAKLGAAKSLLVRVAATIGGKRSVTYRRLDAL